MSKVEALEREHSPNYYVQEHSCFNECMRIFLDFSMNEQKIVSDSIQTMANMLRFRVCFRVSVNHPNSTLLPTIFGKEPSTLLRLVEIMTNGTV